MTLRLVERLNAVRHRYFVGRKQECDLFQAALTATELPFSILYVFGLGGVGKTTLLWQFAQICRSTQIPVIYLDGRVVEPSSQSFLKTLQSIIQVSSTELLMQSFAAQPRRRVLLIDSYEQLAPLEDWLRKEFLPQLPEQMLIVLAGRCCPTSAWQADPGWQAVFHPVALQNLSVEESQLYLAKRSIPAKQHGAIADFTHGHPLALSLTVDLCNQDQETTITSAFTSSVIQVLLETFLEEVPSCIHRRALQACAVVRWMTEALLAEMLQLPDVHELFEWLRGLSFMEAEAFGLMPQEIVREAVVADLRWRHPDRWTEFHQRAQNYYSSRLAQTQGQEQHQTLWECLFLHHHQSVVKSRFVWQIESTLTTDTFCESDRATILKMVTEYEGKTSARLAAHWLNRQPQNVFVFRDANQQISGFLMVVALHQASAEDLDTDPAALAAWRYLQHQAPLRSGEGALLYRFWMAQDRYQAVSPTQTLIFINTIQHYRHTPGIAFTFFSCADPEFWAPLFAYTEFSQFANAAFEVDGHCYSVYGQDWRLVSPTLWWNQLEQRKLSNTAPELPLSPMPSTLPLGGELPIVLSQPEFVQAVRDALRHFVRPDALHNNPLLRSRLVIEQSTRCDRESRIAILQAQLQEATKVLQGSPRDEKLYRVLQRTYFEPALTQEKAAELLDLPFSTYRRYLKAGITRVAEILWQREVLSI